MGLKFLFINYTCYCQRSTFISKFDQLAQSQFISKKLPGQSFCENNRIRMYNGLVR